MRRRAILSLTASALLAACAHQGGPAAMPGMAWSLNHAEGEGAKLAYGQPASDNVLLMMTCQPRSGRVTLSLAGPAGATPRAIEITSRKARSRFAATSSPDPLSGGALLEAVAPAGDAALTSFARSGDLTLVEAGRSTSLPVRPGERAAVAGFFASCRA